jgi:hypothetical protein
MRALMQATAGNRTCPSIERHTKHLCQMTYNSILYNREAADKDPALLQTSVTVRSKGQVTSHRYSTACPLCHQPGADSREHIFHRCSATADAREALRSVLEEVAQSAYGVDPLAAAQAAGAILLRPDYFAGQIASQARDVLRDARAQASNVPVSSVRVSATGRLQKAVLAHSIIIHKMGAKAIPKTLQLLEFRKAMWAQQSTARRLASDASRRQKRSGSATAQPTAPAQATFPVVMAIQIPAPSLPSAT